MSKKKQKFGAKEISGEHFITDAERQNYETNFSITGSSELDTSNQVKSYHGDILQSTMSNEDSSNVPLIFPNRPSPELPYTQKPRELASNQPAQALYPSLQNYYRRPSGSSAIDIMPNSTIPQRLTEPEHPRTVLIFYKTNEFDKELFLKHIHETFKRSFIQRMLVDKSSNKVYVLCSSIRDAAEFVDYVDKHLQIPAMQITNPDDIDFELNQISVHGDNLLAEESFWSTIERVLVGSGHSLVNCVNSNEEPRSKILCFNTNDLTATFELLNRIAQYYFCSPVKRTRHIFVVHKDLQFPIIVEYMKKLAGPNDIECIFQYINGAKVTFKSVEALRRLRVEKLTGLQQLGLNLYDINQCLTKEFYSQIPPALLAKTTHAMVPQNMPPINTYPPYEPRFVSYDERQQGMFANFNKQENLQAPFQLAQTYFYPTGHPPFAHQLAQPNVQIASNFEYSQKLTEPHFTTDTQYGDPKQISTSYGNEGIRFSNVETQAGSTKHFMQENTTYPIQYAHPPYYPPLRQNTTQHFEQSGSCFENPSKITEQYYSNRYVEQKHINAAFLNETRSVGNAELQGVPATFFRQENPIPYQTTFRQNSSQFSEHPTLESPHNCIENPQRMTDLHSPSSFIKADNQYAEQQSTGSTIAHTFSKSEMALLLKSKLIENQKDKYKNKLKIDINKDECQICVSGEKIVVDLFLDSFVKNVTEMYKRFQVDENEFKDIMDILKTEGCDERINNRFNETKINAHFTIENGEPTILFENTTGKDEIKKTIKTYILTEYLKLNQVEIQKFGGSNWEKYFDKLRSKNNDYKFAKVEINKREKQIKIIAPLMSLNKLKKKIQFYLDNQTITEKEMPFENKKLDYAQHFLRQELQQMETNAASCGVEIRWKNNQVIITGLEEGVLEIEKTLLYMSNLIQQASRKLEMSGIEEYLGGKGAVLLKEVGESNSCLLSLSTKSPIKNAPKPEKDVNDKCIYTSKIETTKVTFMLCNLSAINTKTRISFITPKCKSESSLPRGFNGDKADWSKVKGELICNGDYCKTKKSKEEITLHFLYNLNDTDMLKEKMKNCFKYILNKNMNIVAFSIDQFESNTVETFLNFIKKIIYESHNFKELVFEEIQICSMSRDLLEKAANCFPEKSTAPLRTERSKKSPKSGGDDHHKETVTTKRFKELQVELKLGDILSEKTDIIVTSISHDLDMSKAMVSKNAAERGGSEIQKDLKTKYPNGIKVGGFAVSTSGKLAIKYLFHVCLEHWDDNKTNGIVMKLIDSILTEADKLSCISIAIPALGTGKLNFDSKKTCRCILESIEGYANRNLSTTVKKVNLVVFSSNTDIHRAYREIFSEGSAVQGSQVTNTHARLSTQIANTCVMGNIETKVITGDITEQSTHAIVITVDTSLDLNKGKVARTVLAKGGQEIQTELKKTYPTGIKHYECANVKGGKMKCQRIFLLSLPDWSVTIKSTVTECLVDLLKKIEKSEYLSISLPAFGTGNLGYPPEDSKDITFDAIRKFSESYPIHLNRIEIVVHPSDDAVKQAYLEKVNAPGILSATATYVKGIFSSIFSSNVNTISSKDVVKYTNDKITLTLKKADLLQEQCDAIVVAMPDTMDFNKAGEICKQIAKKCSGDFLQKCKDKSKSLSKKSLLIQDNPGGSVKCNSVFVLSSNQYSEDWDTGIKNILKKANSKSLSSIAFPLFGDESGKNDFVCSQIVSSFKDYLTSSPKSLFDVRIVVIDQETFDRLQKILNETLNSKHLSECAYIEITYKDENEKSRAIQSLTKKCQSAYNVRRYTSTAITEFTKEQVFKLDKIGKENLLKVKVSKNEVHVTGFGDCSTIENEIKEIEMEDLNSVLNSIQIVRWQYKKDGLWLDFNNPINLKLHSAKNANKKECNFEMNDEKYTLDFVNGTAKNKTTGITMEIKLKKSQGEALPHNWDDMEESDSLITIPLHQTSEEYKKVETHYKQNGARGTISRIERIQNISLWQQYAAKKREIEKRNPGHENEMLLYHGSDLAAIKDINKYGFNRSYCGKNAVLFGDGVYFAKAPAYSEMYAKPDESNTRRLYQARVLVGKSIITQQGMKYLPKRPDCDAPYDSGRAPDERKEGIFIIFHDSQAYPDYLLTVTLPSTETKK